MRTTLVRALPAVLTLALGAAGCASAPPAGPARPATPTFEQKMAWMLRLEDQRILRDQTGPADLVTFMSDGEARVRRRAALAAGHVGLRDGVPPLLALLADPDAEVRQMAAFALGLLGDASARDRLVAALGDASPLVQGSAAEALGLIGDPAAADALGAFLARLMESGAVAQLPPDAEDAARDTPAAAFRLGVYALVRLKAYGPLAAVVLDGAGQPRVRWWPVAYALQRLEDPRAQGALMTLAREAHPYTRAFAVKGLGAIKSRAAVPMLVPLAAGGNNPVTIEAIRALAKIGDPQAAPALVRLVTAADTEPHVRVEAVAALSGMHAPGVFDLLLDVLADPDPGVRAAAVRSAVAIDPGQFVAVLSGLDPDAHWSVRAALAGALGGLPPAAGLPRLNAMLADTDQRVVPAVIEAMVKLKAPNLQSVLVERLKADDPVVRAAAATGLGELKLPVTALALADAYTAAQRDPEFTTRAAVLAAIAKFGPTIAGPVLRSALADKDWAVRVRAAMLLKQIDPAGAADVDAQIRPAPTTLGAEGYQIGRLIAPPVSTQVYIDTDRGTIQIELAVIEAPLTVESFLALARKGFFNGLSVHRVVPDFVVQTGDPRGDGEGGPGYTIRDEFNERPYLRGTVGMALDPWPDTGGSQFFITHSPQPHLDGKYTVFGRVVAGMEVVDELQPWDVIRRIRTWDGQTMTRNR